MNDSNILTLYKEFSNAISLTFSPCGKFLASCSADSVIDIMSINETSHTWKIITSFKCDESVTDITYSLCGKIIIMSGDGFLCFWDGINFERPLATIENDEGMGACALSPCGKMIARGVGLKTFGVWCIDKDSDQFGECLKEPVDSDVCEGYVEFSRCGKYILGYEEARVVRFWKVEHCEATAKHCEATAKHCEATAKHCEATAKHWQLIKEVKLPKYFGEAIGVVCRFSPCGKYATSCTGEVEIDRWLFDIEENDVLKKLETVMYDDQEANDSYSIESFEYSPDGSSFVTCTDYGTVCVWSVDQDSGEIGARVSWKHESEDIYIRNMSFSPCGKFVACCSGEEGSYILKL